MIHYTKNEPVGKPAYYTCVFNNHVIGSIEQEVDGYYYFWPLPRGGFWESSILRDISNKLDSLNEAWDQRLKSQLATCTDYTPDHPFTD